MGAIVTLSGRRGVVIGNLSSRGAIASSPRRGGVAVSGMSTRGAVFNSPPQGPAGRNAGLVWNDATDDQTLLRGNAYKANSISQLVFEFTGIGILGDQIKVQGYGLGGFHITIPNDITVRQEGNPNIITAIDSNYHESDSVIFTCVNNNETWIADMRGCTPTLL